MIQYLLPAGIVSLIFGGCCSNVFALEAILKYEPDSGLLITFAQFIFVVLCTYPSQVDTTMPWGLKQSEVPFYKWAISATMFFSINMLNNWAFAFQISVPVHIVLRSFGSVTTMAAGWLRGKRYSLVQILSVLLLTVGVVISAWADAASKGKSMSTGNIELTSASFEAGLLILLIAQFLSAYMGVYVQDIYADHGNHWDENLFYSHFLSLPLFLPFQETLLGQFHSLTRSKPIAFSGPLLGNLPQSIMRIAPFTPQSVLMLTINAITQFACISGVNLLSAKTSAVTVTIVLNIRKLVSFIFSIWLFGNDMSGLMLIGAGIVFGAGVLYGWETSFRLRRKTEANIKNGRK